MSNIDYYQKKYQRSVENRIRGGSNPVPYPDPQLQTNYATAERTEPSNVTTQGFATSSSNADTHQIPARSIPQTKPFKAYSPNALSPNIDHTRQHSSLSTDSPETAHAPDRITQLKERLKLVRTERDDAIRERDEAFRERDEARADKDNMLTEFVAMEEGLDKAEAEILRYQNELSSLRGSQSRQYPRGRNMSDDTANHYRREQSYEGDSQLRSQIQRLQNRCAKAEAQADQLQSQQSTITAESEYRLRAAESKASSAIELANFHEGQAQTYLRQLMELRDTNSVQAVAAAAAIAEQESQKFKIDTQALEKLKTELDDARKLSDFFKTNSETTAKRQKEIIVENRQLQDALYAKDREVLEQRGLIEALRLQMNDNMGVPGTFPAGG